MFNIVINRYYRNNNKQYYRKCIVLNFNCTLSSTKLYRYVISLNSSVHRLITISNIIMYLHKNVYYIGTYVI